MALRIRESAGEEHEQIKRLSHSRTAPARQVERARIVQLASQGHLVPAIAAHLQIGQDVVRVWLKRFTADGLAGLADRPRAGRPATYTAQTVGGGMATAATPPTTPVPAVRRWLFPRL